MRRRYDVRVLLRVLTRLTLEPSNLHSSLRGTVRCMVMAAKMLRKRTWSRNRYLSIYNDRLSQRIWITVFESPNSFFKEERTIKPLTPTV